MPKTVRDRRRRLYLRAARWLLQRSAPIPLDDDQFFGRSAGSLSAAGIDVTHDKALGFTAAYAAISLLSNTVGVVPLHLIERRTEDIRLPARSHPGYSLMHRRPNPWMTSFRLRQTMQGHLSTWGNTYGFIERRPDFIPRAIWPLRPDRMDVDTDGAELKYTYRTKDGSPRVLPTSQILHIRGFGGDGLKGYSPIRLFREAIGLGLAAEEFGARFYANDATPGGVLKSPDELDDEAYTRMKKSWEQAHRGLQQAHKIAILEQGTEWQNIGLPLEDIQFIAGRQFQIEEAARIWNVPLHLLHHLLRATFSNIEHQQIHFQMYSMDPWFVNWEQELNMALLAPHEWDRFYYEFKRTALLRAAIIAQNNAFAVAIDRGWMCPDDVLKKLNEPPLPDGQGKVFRFPQQMMAASAVVTTPQEPEQKDKASRTGPPSSRTESRSGVISRRRIGRSFLKPYADLAGRIIRRERQDVLAEAARIFRRSELSDFLEWLEDFYRGHSTWIQEKSLPTLAGLTEAVGGDAADEVGVELPPADELEEFTRDYALGFSSRHSFSSFGQLRKVAREATEQEIDPVEAMEERFDSWEETRPERIAKRETVQQRGSVARWVYVGAGIVKLRWVAHGKNCPWCNNLNGRVVGIDQSFMDPGSHDVEGADSALLIRRPVLHEPLHKGCDCGIAPEF